MGFETPVAFLIFNRPDTTERVFREIARVRPGKLLVVADGARPDKAGEAEKCAAARAIIERVDWDCEVLKNYSDVNLGCRRRVSSGLDWVFDMVEEAVILEDDCLPSQSFFPFCEELLARYRHDDRIMQISGSNYLEKGTDESYFFSKYGPIWGWASWRRAWKLYDVGMKLWPKIKKNRLHYDFCFNENEIAVREALFDSVYNGDIDTWDYQWVFSRFANNGLSITPQKNLITNIGFGEDATHTKSKSDARGLLKRNELVFPLTHPEAIIKNYELDFKYFEAFIKQTEQKPKWVGFINSIMSGKSKSK